MSHDYTFTLSLKQSVADDMLMQDDTESLLYGGAKGGGKSYFGCLWMFQRCLKIIEHFRLPKTKYPLLVGFMGRKRSVDFSDTTLESWKKTIPPEAYVIRTTDKEIIINQRVKIAYGGFDSEENIAKFNSAEFAYYFIDQAEEVSQDDIALLKGTMRLKIRKQGIKYKGLLTANPADCWLKDEFIYSSGRGNKFLQALPIDNPYLPKDYVARLTDAFKHRPELVDAYVKGSWDALADGDLVIKGMWINDAIKKDMVVHDKPAIVVCDPARFGDDETVIYVFRGGQIIDSMCYGQKSTTDTGARCVMMKNKHKAELIFVDSIGIGGGVADSIKDLEEDVYEINFSCKGSNEIMQQKFHNLRAEVYWVAANRFADGTVSIPNDIVLRQQLSHVRYSVSSMGKIKIESKGDIKKRLSGKSPDRADAVVMGLWGEQFVTNTYNDYRRFDGTSTLKSIANSDGYGWNQLNPLYEESLRELAADQTIQSDYSPN